MEEIPKIPGIITSEENILDAQIDTEYFIEEQRKKTLDKIIAKADLDKENMELDSFEVAKLSIERDLRALVDFLSTTEKDQDVARRYYTKLYDPIFAKIQIAKSLDDIVKTFESLKFEDITSRFYGIIKGSWRELGTDKRRGLEDIDILEAEPVKKVFYTLMITLRNFQLMKQGLSS